MAAQSGDYAIGHSDQELERLTVQARAFEPLTRRLFIEAGLAPGMNVLDIGSGAGDVSFLAAEIVGSSGAVVGVDQSQGAVEHASARAHGRRLTNVSFHCGQLESLPFGRDFDAIVGRLILMYLPDPASVLRSLLWHVKPKAIIVFQEMDILATSSTPPAPVVDRAREWIHEAFRRVGAELQMGPKLYPTFTAAGLPPPRLNVQALMGGAESEVPLLVADVVRALLPVMEAHGITTAAEADVQTLEQRMREDLRQTGGVASTPLLVGAWTHKLGLANQAPFGSLGPA